jgi:hypothetical protein
VKEPEKFLIPSRDLILIALREDEPDESISFALLIDIPLHLNHESAIDSHRWVHQ